MSTHSRKTHDVITLAAIGVAAHILADVTHEVIGHGGICLLTGGKITLLTSVFFRNQPLSRIVAAAGPLANLVMGLLLWLVFKSKQNWSPALCRIEKRRELKTRMGLLRSLNFSTSVL